MRDSYVSEERPVLLEEIPAEHYRDPQRFRDEIERVFTRHWLIAARLEDIPKTGALATRTGQRDVLLTRRGDTVRAFHNVCSHRGMTVVPDRMNGSELRCGYHGWTYGLDGALETVPGRRRFADLDLSSCGLPQITAQVWGGWVWVRLAGQGDSFDEWLGPWADELLRYRTDRQQTFAQRSDQVSLNWKATVDAFNETYHVAWVHPETVGQLVDGKASWFRYGGHHSRMVIPVRRSLAESQGRREGSRPAQRQLDKDLLDEQRRDHCNYTVFPNVVLNFLPTWGIVLQFEPIAVDRTEIRTTMLTDPPASERQTAAFHAQWGEFSKVLDEDLVSLEYVGRGFRSPAFTQVRFGGEEERLVHFHQVVEEALR
jgi:phenylpropionate dioxygenase-like ring-hydroxylating dioxygenase large terminal subunit